MAVRYLVTFKSNPPQSPLVRGEALIRGDLEGFDAREQELQGTSISIHIPRFEVY
jgi:hypothetical protein